MNATKKIHLLFALTIAFAASFTCASGDKHDNIGWFVGGSLGSSKADFEIFTTKESENSALIGPYGGYNFTEWFGIEGRTLIGEYLDGTLLLMPITPRFTLPLNDSLGLFVRAGLASMAIIDEDNYDDDDVEWSGVVRTLGIGARIDLANNLKLNIAYDYYSGTLENDDRYVLFRNLDLDVTQRDLNFTVYYQF